MGRAKNDALEHGVLIAQDDQYFNNVPERYASLIPNPRYSNLKAGIDISITDSYDAAISTFSSVINAIIDYCNEDGVFTEESKAVLDSYLRKKNGSPGNDGGSGDGSANTIVTDPTIKNEELSIDESDINKSGTDGYKSQGVDEELMVPSVTAAAALGGWFCFRDWNFVCCRTRVSFK